MPTSHGEPSIYEKAKRQKELSEAKRAKMRQQKLDEELSHMRNPTINKTSSKMVSHKSSIAERSALLQKKKEAKVSSSPPLLLSLFVCRILLKLNEIFRRIFFYFFFIINYAK